MRPRGSRGKQSEPACAPLFWFLRPDPSFSTDWRTPRMADALPLVPDLLCFSHLRWDFVFQRPQHLLTRFARERRVFFFEEPMRDSASPELEVREVEAGGRRVIPPLPPGIEAEPAVRTLLDELIGDEQIRR